VFLRAALAALFVLELASCRTPRSNAFSISVDGVGPEVAAAVEERLKRVNANGSAAADWLALGMVCEANGLTGDARRAYEQAVARDPLQPRAWYRLAIAHGRNGELDKALEASDRAIALDSSYAPAHWRRGLWLLENGSDVDARAAFEKATTLDAANPGGWIGLARVALREQRPAQAVETLERFLSQHPGDRYAILLLGTAYQRLGKTDDAQYALAVGATGEPNWPDPWSDELAQYRVGFAQNLKAATAQLLNGQFAAAIPALEQLSRERPDDLSLMHQLGLSYVAAGRAVDGIKLLEQALTRDPANVESHLRLASAYLNRQDFERALSHAERAIALDPELGRAYETRGMALWRSGRANEALGVFEQALRFDPSNVSALVWMGSILLDSGQPDRALAHFERAIRRNPMLADAFVGIALVMVQRRRFDDAEGALSRAEMIDPQNPRLSPARSRLEAARSTRAPRP
jgi:tetratricopeptide (TPR) repeat protein